MNTSPTLSRVLNPYQMVELGKRLESTHTTGECMDTMYRYLRETKSLPKYIRLDKDDLAANRVLASGDKFFSEKNYIKSLKTYSKALQLAKSVQTNTKCYVKRSVTLFQLGLYKECEIDCDRALNHEYSQKLRERLLRRKDRALQRYSGYDFKYYEDIPIISQSRRNATMPSASDSITIRKDEINGRHIVATRNINVGEVLLVEEPYCNIITEQMYNRCHHCLEVCYNLIPCGRCTWILFCSEACKKNACEYYHEFECLIVPTLMHMGLSWTNLSLRMTLRRYLQESGTRSDNRKFCSDRFKELSEVKTMTSANRLVDCCYIATILYYLVEKHTDFLQRYQDEDFKELLLFCCIKSNESIEVREQSYTNTHHIARALYSTLNVFNHSCCPNTTMIFYGQNVVIRAIKSIKRDEQCFISYGPCYYNLSKQVRQTMLLDSRNFHCKCKACTEDWPLLALLGRQDASLREVKLVSDHLGKNYDFRSARNFISRTEKLLTEFEYFQPCYNHALAQNALSHCYSMLGNKKRFKTFT